MSLKIIWSDAPAIPQLRGNEVHLWQAQQDVSRSLLETLSPYLSSNEMARASRMVFPRDQVRTAASRGILRQVLSRYLNVRPETIVFAEGPNGKPFLSDANQGSGICFNSSHSQGYQLVAVTSGQDVGVDVEWLLRDVAILEVAKHHFSESEFRDLASLPDVQRTEGFFNCWTRKEAYLKARGEGLQLPLKSFQVSLIPGRPTTLASGDSAGWSIYSLEPADEFKAAAVVAGSNHEFRFYHWR